MELHSKLPRGSFKIEETPPNGKMVRKMKWHSLALRNQSRKQASRNANYELKRQALTNKDQRAVLSWSFLAIASAPATAIAVLCKQRYVRKLNLGNAWCLARSLRIEIAYRAWWHEIIILQSLWYWLKKIFEFHWRQVRAGCAEDMSKIRWVVARVGTCNWDYAHTHSYRFSAMIQRAMWDQFGLGYLIQVVVLLAIL